MPFGVGGPGGRFDVQRAEQLTLGKGCERLVQDRGRCGRQELHPGVVVDEALPRGVQLRRLGDVGDVVTAQSCHRVAVPRAVDLGTSWHRQDVTPGVPLRRRAHEDGKEVRDRCVQPRKQTSDVHDRQRGRDHALDHGEHVARCWPAQMPVEQHVPSMTKVEVRGVGEARVALDAGQESIAGAKNDLVRFW